MMRTEVQATEGMDGGMWLVGWLVGCSKQEEEEGEEEAAPSSKWTDTAALSHRESEASFGQLR